jgi:hypothetical protein
MPSPAEAPERLLVRRSLDQEAEIKYQRSNAPASVPLAKLALPAWRTGRRKMSGLVASRLFSLLPGHMPIARKFDLVKSLWEAKCPYSHKTFYIGPDADMQQVIASVRQHLTSVVQSYAIPDSIVVRFQWLARDDVRLQQQLHNYFLQLN